jgi:hypothetical protein
VERSEALVKSESVRYERAATWKVELVGEETEGDERTEKGSGQDAFATSEVGESGVEKGRIGEVVERLASGFELIDVDDRGVVPAV